MCRMYGWVSFEMERCAAGQGKRLVWYDFRKNGEKEEMQRGEWMKKQRDEEGERVMEGAW